MGHVKRPASFSFSGMKPNRLLIVFLTLCAGICAGYGQIILKTGETFTYAFTNLPFAETVRVSGATPGCGVTVFYQSGDFFFEMFEDSGTETPFAASGSVGPPAFWFGFPYHWQDLQGVLRFTALSDDVVIDRFKVDAYVPRDPVSDIYSVTFVPASDTDLDGVPNSEDICPSTPAGATVDAQGCSIDQLVPCAGPASGSSWKNHGQYVSAIARTAEAFITAGLITEVEKNAVVSAAVKSDCGRNPTPFRRTQRNFDLDYKP